MCFPQAIPLAMTVGGSLLNSAGESKAARSQAAASDQERARQNQFSTQQMGYVDRSRDALANVAGTGTDQAVDARKTLLMSALDGRSPTQDALPGSGSADRVIAENGARVAGNEHAAAAQTADAMARLSGLGDSLFSANIGMNRNAQQIGQIGGFKAGSAAALPTELQAAAHKGETQRMLGQLASEIGTAWLQSTGGLKLPKITKTQLPASWNEAAAFGTGAMGGPIV